MKLSVKLISCLIIVCMMTTGCSMFKSSTQNISVTTDYSDAEIFVNGNMVGEGSVQTRVKRNKNVSILAKKPGYKTAQRNVGTHFSHTAMLDMVGGFLVLIPFVGLFAPGAYDLDETNIYLSMSRDS